MRWLTIIVAACMGMPWGRRLDCRILMRRAQRHCCSSHRRRTEHAPCRGAHRLIFSRTAASSDGMSISVNLRAERDAAAAERDTTVDENNRLRAAGNAPIAAEALQRIAGLYAPEAEIRGQPATERLRRRQQSAQPIIDVRKPRLEARLAEMSRKAIRYALSRLAGLARLLDDGHPEIGNNAVGGRCGRSRRGVHCAPLPQVSVNIGS
jgi:Transposase IS66 family